MAIRQVGATTVPIKLIAAAVGERKRARIILEGIRTTTTQSRTSQSNYVV
jgi:hypothetical protein